MPVNSKPRTARRGERFFAAIHRCLPPLRWLSARINAPPRGRVDGVFWILLLLGTLPALRAQLLFPFSWVAQLGSGLALGGAEDPFGWLSLAAVLVLFVLAAARHDAARLLAIPPFILITLANGPAGDYFAGLNSVYVGAAFVAFIYFVVAGRTRSMYFLIYVAALCVGQYFDELLTWPQIATFVATSIAASLVYETWRQNRPMLKQLGKENVAALLWQSFSLWSPTILLIAAGLTISHWIISSAEEFVYEGTFVDRYCRIEGAAGDLAVPCPESGDFLAVDEIVPYSYDTSDASPANLCALRRYWNMRYTEIPTGPEPRPFDCPAGFPDVGGWTVERLPFQLSLDHSVDRTFEVTQWQANQRLYQIDQGALNTSQDVGPEARRLFGVVPETPGISIASCEWYDLPCHIVGMVKRTLINAYVRVRSRTEQRFVNTMQARADAIAAGVVGANTAIGDEIATGIDDWNRETRAALTRTYTAYSLFDTLVTFWLIVIAIKSFLYVFARVIFDRKTDVHVDLQDDDTTLREGMVTHVQEVTIRGDYPYDLYYKSNYQPLGPAPRFSIPQPGASLLSRLRFGAWNLSHVPMPCDDELGVTFNSVQADHLVDWQMAEGEEIVFSYRNFVAMNENVELRTIVSLRVASLLMGRFVFHAARCTGGPGRLILRTRGRPATAAQVRQSIPMTRLVAWNRYARFSVDSHLTRTDVFLNGFNLRRSEHSAGDTPHGILVVEADARDGGVLFGTLRFAKHFLLPV